MDHDTYTDGYIRGILQSVKSIAVVGASAKETRPSFFVTKYLIAKGYKVYPINPGWSGKEIAGAMTYAGLADLPGPVDMVDIFRKTEALPQVVSQIMAMSQLPKVAWMQLTIRDDRVAQALEMADIKVVQDRCPKIEYARLCGEIGWTGYNRRTISSKKPRLSKGFQHYGLNDPNDL